jgi:hypothetical protein
LGISVDENALRRLGMPRAPLLARSRNLASLESRAPGGNFMKKWCMGVLMSSVALVATGACGGDKNANPAPCKTGALACACYPNDTCDGQLSCFAELCLDLSAAGGAGSLGQGGGDVEPVGGASDQPIGGEGAIAGSGAGAGLGGSMSLGGSSGTAGEGTSGTAGQGASGTAGQGTSGSASGGTGTVEAFPPDPAGCALVTTCPTCCETTGVYALDTLANDATAKYVTCFTVTEEAALAEFDFASYDQVGAIFFRFATAQDIGTLGVSGVGTGGSLEVALVRAQGKDGCIYPIVGGSLSPTPDTCWGLGAGPYALLPADQIEVRVRALQPGRAALNVTGVVYGP